jgi:hypothetical protein
MSKSSHSVSFCRHENCRQRKYLRSGGNLKLRLVPSTERNKDNKTLNHTSTPPGANILLAVVGLVRNRQPFFSIFSQSLIYCPRIVNCQRSPTPYLLSRCQYVFLVHRFEIEFKFNYKLSAE